VWIHIYVFIYIHICIYIHIINIYTYICREDIHLLTADLENKLIVFKRNLTSEMEASCAESLERFREGRSREEDKARKMEGLNLEESRRRQEGELSALREKLKRNRQTYNEKGSVSSWEIEKKGDGHRGGDLARIRYIYIYIYVNICIYIHIDLFVCMYILYAYYCIYV
jgi:hypothetical protein